MTDVCKSLGFCVACQDASMLCDTGVVCCGVFYFIQAFSADGKKELWDKSRKLLARAGK